MLRTVLCGDPWSLTAHGAARQKTLVREGWADVGRPLARARNRCHAPVNYRGLAARDPLGDPGRALAQAAVESSCTVLARS